MNSIREASKVIQRGWIKGQSSDGQGKFCMSGAMYCVTAGGDAFQHAVKALDEVVLEQFPDRVHIVDGRNLLGMATICFNDNAETTKEEVLAVMEKAAIKLDEIS